MQRPVLVEFYSPTCPHCVNLVGVWRKVARNLAGHVVVGGVNCREDPLCGQYNVKGVPSIKLFTKDDRGKMLVLGTLLAALRADAAVQTMTGRGA